MLDYWQIHPYTIVAFLAYCLLTALGNSLFLHRLGSGPSRSGDFPFVSILIPARNEAANIATCVRSLLAQEYPAFEVIVLNDQSTDETGDILNEIQVEHPGLKVVLRLPRPTLPGGMDLDWLCFFRASGCHSAECFGK